MSSTTATVKISVYQSTPVFSICRNRCSSKHHGTPPACALNVSPAAPGLLLQWTKAELGALLQGSKGHFHIVRRIAFALSVSHQHAWQMGCAELNRTLLSDYWIATVSMFYAKRTTSRVSVGDALPNETGLAKVRVLAQITHPPVQHFLVSWV